jgi:hypothetical protein
MASKIHRILRKKSTDKKDLLRSQSIFFYLEIIYKYSKISIISIITLVNMKLISKYFSTVEMNLPLIQNNGSELTDLT